VNEIELLQNTIRHGMDLLCAAMGTQIDDYDSDDADIQCYLNCFKDAAAELERLQNPDEKMIKAGIKAAAKYGIGGMSYNHFTALILDIHKAMTEAGVRDE